MSSYYILKSFSKLTLLFFVLSIGMPGCSTQDSNDDDSSSDLYVKFINDNDANITITSIELQAMGDARDSIPTPGGVWSENVLEDGAEIEADSAKYFHADIPNMHWSKYRLAVRDSNGTTINLHEQVGYNEFELPITHWGSDERTVSVRLVQDPSSGFIRASGYMEHAGIDD